MQGLFGTYKHKLDAKHRLTVPSAFRKVLPENLVVTVSPKGDCLYVFDQPGFTDWVHSLFEHDDGYDTGNEAHIELRLVFNSLGQLVEVDNAHRIGLSVDQCEQVGLGKDVVILGDDDHLAIWDAKRWDDFLGKVDRMAIYRRK